MALFTERPYSRVMVFIDYRNIVKSTDILGNDIWLDLYRLTDILVGSRNLIGAYVFDAKKKYAEKDDKTLIMHDKLRDGGFRVIARDSIVTRDGKTEQKEVDVSLACEMLEHALLDHYDVAIVISGDRDFVPAMQKVQAAGKRVEVAAFDDTYSDECKKTADVYYVLNKVPFLSLSSPNYKDYEVK